jgi:hypothetical protein
MSKARGKNLVFSSLWSGGGPLAASRPSRYSDLTFNARIPMNYWRPDYRFIGLSDDRLYRMSNGAFPRRLEPKTRPLHSLEELPHNVAYKVCPCSSRRPFDMCRVRFVREGCRLLHTNHVVDRKSYLIENVPLNIPSSMYRELRFRGEVPKDCLGIDFR